MTGGRWGRPMEAERAEALNGMQLRTLIDALLDAFVERLDFEQLLTFRLDRSFDLIAGEGGLQQCVFRLVSAAKSQGWLQDLIEAARQERPRNSKLRTWVESVDATSTITIPFIHQLLDTAYFDLDDLRRIIARVKNESATKVLAFGVDYPDQLFVRKLCDWLVSYLGDAQCKEPLNLMPELAPVARRIRHVIRYRPELSSSNVLCVVHAADVPAETIGDFWTAISTSFQSIEHYLVLIFIGRSDTAWPAGIIVLPSPQFEVYHVDLWTHEMVRRLGWPIELGDVWTELLCDESMDDDVIDVRGLYETLDRSIRDLCFSPVAFRRFLEERRGDAYAS
jgi:Effector-associated domain 1